MKKLLISMLAVIFALVAGPAMPADFAADFGQDASFETSHTMSPGDSVVVDLHTINLPEKLGNNGCVMTYDTSLVSLTAIDIFDTGTGGGIAGVGEIATYSSVAGCWDKTMGGLTWISPGQLIISVGTTVGCPAAGSDDIYATLYFTCTGPGDATVKMDNSQTKVVGQTGSVTVDNDPHNLTIHQVVECVNDGECNDGLWCTAYRTCDTTTNTCVGTLDNVCDDSEACTLDGCTEPDTSCGKACTISLGACLKDSDCPAGGMDTCATILDCENDAQGTGVCDNGCDSAFVNSTGGSTSFCCASAPCDALPICSADVTLIKEDGFYQPPPPYTSEVVTIKNPVCLENPDDLVGGIQFDLCDSPDCLTCIDCELTERTVMFDCEVVELGNGCCRVLMFCKNPGCAINPGLCDIVTIVMQTKGGPLCNNICIEENFENIVVSDYDGVELAGAGIGGELCPVACGDVCPAGSGTLNDCGDAVVDIYDIMCEVNFALADVPIAAPNFCQLPRADVPTGTPPNCIGPDGDINILDIMVLIDMALNRQDCCTFYYTGVMY